MVETIAPVVYGNRSRYVLAGAVHVAAATVAGALFGAGLGLTGLVLSAPWGPVGLWLVVAVGLLYAIRELAGLQIPIFDRKQQVPDWWRTYFGRFTTAGLYGAGLGIGFLTFLRHGTYVAVCATALAAGDLAVGAMLGGAFGFARGITAFVGAATRDEEGAALVVAALERVAKRPVVRLINAAACGALALTALLLAI